MLQYLILSIPDLCTLSYFKSRKFCCKLIDLNRNLLSEVKIKGYSTANGGGGWVGSGFKYRHSKATTLFQFDSLGLNSTLTTCFGDTC